MKRMLPTLICLSTLFISGCAMLEGITKVGTTLGAATGTISWDEAHAINRTASAAGKALENITPEQEYYIGRAVAATILKTYEPYDEARVNKYINQLGQTLAMASDKPETFGGYHFLVMDTDEVNAFAAPGGLILVSRGLLRCCETEDALAAVLAHEVGHVELAHGLRAIKKGRITSALTILAAESAKNLGGEQVAELTQAFEGSISDITATMVNSGYARKLEKEADLAAIEILKRVGYDPNGLRDMLQKMGERMHADDGGFAKTHPSPADRITEIETALAGDEPVQPPAVRQSRFDKAMRGV